jgi:uracil-DNA glycosylase
MGCFLFLKNNTTNILSPCMGMALAKDWHAHLKEEIAKPYILDLKNFLLQEKRENKIIYPPEPLVFHAFSSTPYEEVKVIIIGQDPYHGPGQAHGLSFSVPCGIPQPPSLKNIFKELQDDLGIIPPQNGCLSGWAKQGVLLLNATLTVRAGEPRSHYGKGWERFTDAVVAGFADRSDLVFVLWGKSAEEKCRHLLKSHGKGPLVLVSAHPSPYSASQGFFGSAPFSKVNAHLQKEGKRPIDWGALT